MKRTSLLCLSFILAIITAQVQDYSTYYRNMPVEMPQVKAPAIAANTVNIKDFGSVGDGVTLNTETFRKAISALEKKEGRRLVVPAGVWMTDSISLKGNIDLHIEKNAIVIASPEKSLFVKEKDGKKDTKCAPMTSASKRTDISITGEGVTDGNGAYWRPEKRSKVSDTEWNEFPCMGGTLTEEGKLWFPFNLNHYGNIADTPEAQEKMRTHLIRLTDCEKILYAVT